MILPYLVSGRVDWHEDEFGCFPLAETFSAASVFLLATPKERGVSRRGFRQHPTNAKSECLIPATKVYVILWDVAQRFASNLNAFQVSGPDSQSGQTFRGPVSLVRAAQTFSHHCGDSDEDGNTRSRMGGDSLLEFRIAGEKVFLLTAQRATRLR